MTFGKNTLISLDFVVLVGFFITKVGVSASLKWVFENKWSCDDSDDDGVCGGDTDLKK